MATFSRPCELIIPSRTHVVTAHRKADVVVRTPRELSMEASFEAFKITIIEGMSEQVSLCIQWR